MACGSWITTSALGVYLCYLSTLVMPSSHEPLPESSYPPLERPVFTSQIPPYLLEKASESDRYILAQLSILTQFIPWSVEAHLETNSLVRKTNGRLLRAEGDITDIQEARAAQRSGWKAILKSWSLVVGVIGFIASLIEAYWYLHNLK